MRSRSSILSRVVLEILVIVAAAEFLVMMILPLFHVPEGGWLEAAADAAMLAFLSAPLIALRSRVYSEWFRGEDQSRTRIDRRRPMMLAGFVGVLSLSLTYWVYTNAEKGMIRDANSRLVRNSILLSDEIQARLSRLEYGLRGARGIFTGSENVTASEWRTHVESRDLLNEFPGTEAHGFIQRVPRANVPTFVQELAAEDGRSIDLSSKTEEPYLEVLRFVEPNETPNLRIGSIADTTSDLQTAMSSSIKTGRPALSPEPHRDNGVHLRYVLPVYRPGMPIGTETERERACIGWVFFSVRLEGTLSGVLKHQENLIGYQLEEISKGGTSTPMVQHLPGAIGALSWTKSLSVGGRTWRLRTVSTDRFDATIPFHQLKSLLGVGLAISVGMMLLVWLLSRMQQEAQGAAQDAQLESSALRQALDQYAIISNADHKGRIVSVNEEFCRISGYTADELIGQDHRMLNSGTHPRSFWSEMYRTVHEGKAWRGEVCNRGKDGTTYWVDSTVFPLMDREGNLRSICSIRFDITDRKRIEAENNRLALIARRTRNAVIITDSEGLVEWVNEGFTRVTGFSLDEVKGMKPGEFLQGQETEPEAVEKLSLAIRSSISTTVELVNYTKSGDRYINRIELEPLYENNQPAGFMALETDVTAEREMQSTLRQAAQTDLLTGLANRAMILDRLQELLNPSGGAKPQDFALMYLDFDRFKFVNDSLGHKVGDQLLREISQRLSSGLRQSDLVGRDRANGTAARLGGDEFVILLSGISTYEAANAVASRLLKLLGEPYQLDQHSIHSTASIGIVLNDQGSTSPEEILRDADTAMYEAKMAGRGCFRFFDATMRERVQTRLTLENDLRLAVQNEQLTVHYQPIVDIATGQIESMEALVRWVHPTLGNIGPDVFVPIAEDTGQILDIGEWVLRRACLDYMNLQRQMGKRAPRHLCVNLSRCQLVATNLTDRVLGILTEAGMTPNQLHLEITETAVMRDKDVSMRTLAELSSAGIGLDMDDFGTGYSSLGCLEQFPIDVVKIDRLFVANLCSSSRSATMMRAVIHLAHQLGIKVIAEGVETTEQLAALQEMRCDFVQGYLFSRPVSVESVPNALDGIDLIQLDAA